MIALGSGLRKDSREQQQGFLALVAGDRPEITDQAEHDPLFRIGLAAAIAQALKEIADLDIEDRREGEQALGYDRLAPVSYLWICW